MSCISWRCAVVLTGVSDPLGECVNKSGDVWIADTENSRLIEYAYGGTKPVATVSDVGADPLDASSLRQAEAENHRWFRHCFLSLGGDQ